MLLKLTSFTRKLSPRRLLIAAVIFHISLVVAINAVGKAHLLPNTFDEHGIGISFAIDSASYRREATEMATVLQMWRFRDWSTYRSQFHSTFHIQLYSISFALLGKLLGFGTLSAEPLNLLCYLSILVFTYKIGLEVFDPRVALLAAIAVGAWPSLVLHTTQMLRDPLFIGSMLLLVWCLLLCLKRSLSILQGAKVAAAGAIALLLIWLCRPDTWEVVFVIWLLAVTTCVLAQILERRFQPGKLLALLGILLFVSLIPAVLPVVRLSQENRPMSTARRRTFPPADPAAPIWARLSRQVGFLRHQFTVSYPLAGSNVDREVELVGPVDVVKYFPRAVEVGFFSPFPQMWFTRGVQVGTAGRLVAGAETLVMYVVFVLASATLISYRNQLAVWFLFGITSIGCVALGYVIVNMSSLYRMRYTFFILLIILGVKGFLIAFDRFVEPRLDRKKKLNVTTSECIEITG